MCWDGTGGLRTPSERPAAGEAVRGRGCTAHRHGGLFWGMPVTAQWPQRSLRHRACCPETPPPSSHVVPGRATEQGFQNGWRRTTGVSVCPLLSLVFFFSPPSKGNRDHTLAPLLQFSCTLPPSGNWRVTWGDTSVLWACDASSCHQEASCEVRRTSAPPRVGLAVSETRGQEGHTL